MTSPPILGGAGGPPAAPEGKNEVPRWTIRPEPTDEELVALMTVLTVAFSAPGGAEPAPADPVSRWARAGRVAALTPWPPAVTAAWGRRRP
jgi:hypothetical protein